MYIIQLGVAIGSIFNDKLRKMWQGERDAVQTLRKKVEPDADYIWFMLHHWVSSNRDDH